MLNLIYGVLLACIILPLHLLMIAIAWVLAPVLPLAAIDRDSLPSWLSWFQTPDAPLDGDTGFIIKHSATSRYLQRVIWLMRNPAYGFSWTVLACKVGAGVPIDVWGNLNANDDPYLAGWSFSRIRGTHYWQVRFFIKTIPGKCLKARFGWKMKHDALHLGRTSGQPYKYTFTFNPFKKRR